MTFLTLHSLTFHVQSSGDQAAPPLVFLNPLGSDLRVWDAVADGSRRSGESSATTCAVRASATRRGATTALGDHVSDLAALLDALKLERVSLAGCSLGGLVAQAFALAFPERVDRLALLDTLPRIGSEESWASRMPSRCARKG